jgi:hypothetical protein
MGILIEHVLDKEEKYNAKNYSKSSKYFHVSFFRYGNDWSSSSMSSNEERNNFPHL